MLELTAQQAAPALYCYVLCADGEDHRDAGVMEEMWPAGRGRARHSCLTTVIDHGPTWARLVAARCWAA
ncbi:hypothetical protein PR048_007063 [Dryococelus australis]|uniref:Uncharacterized protein n=1 Tax=Dryococelus australis TaxID=614101 RepID=A0ABQ9IDK8_9NEOP|nr:hypothetical protein PR048_007063 [Dryococelus australis]